MLILAVGLGSALAVGLGAYSLRLVDEIDEIERRWAERCAAAAPAVYPAVRVTG